LLHVPQDRNETDQLTEKMLQLGKKISYGDGSIEEQNLWMFHPLDIQPDEKRPCVVFIHGGGWGGKPSSLAAQSLYLRRRGINTVSVHFRAPNAKRKLTPEDTLRDARKAYRWIVEHGHEHHIDVDRLVVSGGSAGGHLSLALSTIGLKDDPVVQHAPAGIVLFNPVIDLVDGWTGGRKKCEQAGIDVQSFSPAHQVRSDLPPTLVLSGSEDGLIPPELLFSFQKRMKAKGNECEVVIYPDAGHGFFNYGREANRWFHPTMWKMEAFVNHVFETKE